MAFACCPGSDLGWHCFADLNFDLFFKGMRLFKNPIVNLATATILIYKGVGTSVYKEGGVKMWAIQGRILAEIVREVEQNLGKVQRFSSRPPWKVRA